MVHHCMGYEEMRLRVAKKIINESVIKKPIDIFEVVRHTVSADGSVSLFTQVLLVGKGDLVYLLKTMCGSMPVPKTGSASLPVTNFKIFSRVTAPLLPAEKVYKSWLTKLVYRKDRKCCRLGGRRVKNCWLGPGSIIIINIITATVECLSILLKNEQSLESPTRVINDTTFWNLPSYN